VSGVKICCITHGDTASLKRSKGLCVYGSKIELEAGIVPYGEVYKNMQKKKKQSEIMSSSPRLLSLSSPCTL
jgi:hypothetical protein